MKPSLKTIAEELSLSKATVSWILSGQGETKGFSASTIKLVKDYAKKIGYRPNLIARSLSVGSTNTIALIIPAIDDTFYSQMTQAVETQSQKHGYTLIVCSSEGDDRKESRLIQALRSKQVDGIIVAPAKDSQRGIKVLFNEAYPLVLIDRYFPELKTNYIIVNNEDSSYDLVASMIKKGAKRIALLTTDTHLFVMNKRIQGYMRAVKDGGLDFDSRLCVEIDRKNYKGDITAKLDELLADIADIDGFFFSTHYLALEAIRYFVTKKIDYSKFHLGCFHTTTALDILAPKMLISMMPIDVMGELAVDVLVQNIGDKNTHTIKEIILPNTLIDI